MIIVTAGHVDHGKTALLKALTGTNTAHLPEEKQRGMTIDLGYAYLPIKDKILGFIDVPGHQKFLSNMLAGLGGIEQALLIIAADEGIKPQTEEHLSILNLLNIHITVVITKIDKIEKTELTSLSLTIKQKYPQFHHTPFFFTSTINNQGIEELKNYLVNLKTQNNTIEKPFRYVIDRIFNLHGIGLVVTGTAIAGKIKIGEEYYLSNNKKIKIKNIHSQNNPAQIGYAGERLALNLAYIEKEEIKRGDWITEINPNYITDRITVKIIASDKIKENQKIHLYHFASHITAKLNLLTEKQLLPMQNSLAEIILDTPLHITVADKLILRNADNSATIAGAMVLEIQSLKRHKKSEQRLTFLKKLAQTTHIKDKINIYLSNSYVNKKQLEWSEQIFTSFLERDFSSNEILFIKNWIFSKSFKEYIQQQLVEKLTLFHQNNNDQLGLTKARLYRITTPNLPEELIYELIDDLIKQNLLLQTRGWIHTINHKIEFNQDELIIWHKIKTIFEKNHQALWVRDIANEIGLEEQKTRNLLYKAGKLGYLVPIVKDRFLLEEKVILFTQIIHNLIIKNGHISVNQLRDEIGYGRKLTVQLVEYFNKVGFLRRKGNIHLLRDKNIYRFFKN